MMTLPIKQRELHMHYGKLTLPVETREEFLTALQEMSTHALTSLINWEDTEYLDDAGPVELLEEEAE